MAKRKIIKMSKYRKFPQEKYEDMGPIRRLERKLDRVNHIMELVRTIVPIMLLILNCIILAKLFNLIYNNLFAITPITIKNIDIIFVVVIFSFKKKYPIRIEKSILVSLNAPTIGIGALVKAHTTIT